MASEVSARLFSFSRAWSSAETVLPAPRVEELAGRRRAEELSSRLRLALRLGSFYVTPELCASALCGVDPSACHSARGMPELAALATRLVAVNATAAKASLESALALAAPETPTSAKVAEARKCMRSCLRLYAGAVPALRWAARAVAAGRYRGAREVLEAAKYVAVGCAGVAGEAALPRENDRFSSMAIVAHAVVASMSTA